MKDKKIMIRVSKEEKETMFKTAKKYGFSSLSEFIRFIFHSINKKDLEEKLKNLQNNQ